MSTVLIYSFIKTLTFIILLRSRFCWKNYGLWTFWGTKQVKRWWISCERRGFVWEFTILTCWAGYRGSKKCLWEHYGYAYLTHQVFSCLLFGSYLLKMTALLISPLITPAGFCWRLHFFQRFLSASRAFASFSALAKGCTFTDKP